MPSLPQVVRDRLDALYAATLAGVPDGAEETAGIAAGAAAANAMLAARADDGRYVPFSFPVGDQPGGWRPTLTALVNDPFAWVARVEPFTLQSRSQFRTDGPRALSSSPYAQEYDEVKNLGAVNSVRTPTQEAVAQFYSVNPVELFNRAFRDYSAARGVAPMDEARLFAMLNIASADTLINCWDDKVHWNFWRPITAIQQGDADGNPLTSGDPAWLPLISTPPYPEHPSGYNCVSAAMTYAAQAFFGEKKTTFTVVKLTPTAPPVTRIYQRFTDVVDDTIDARIFQGLHFRSAEVQGAGIGKHVAQRLAQNYFQPV